MDSAVLLDLLGNENRRRILRLLAHKPCYVTEISEYLGVSPKAVIDHLRRLEDAGLVESRTDDQRRKYFNIAQNLRLEVSVSPYRFGAKSAYPASRSLDMRGCCQYISVELPDERTARGEESERETTEREEDSASETTERGAETEHAEREVRTENGKRNIDTDAGADADADAGADADADVIDPRRANGKGRTGPESATDIDDQHDHNDRRDHGDGGDSDDEVAALARQYAYLEDVESELSLAQRWIHGRVTDVLDRLTDQIGAEADSRFYAEVLAVLVREPRSAREIASELNANPERVETALDRLSDQGLVDHDESGWRIDG